MTAIDDFLRYMQGEANDSPLTVAAYGHDLRELEAFLTSGGKRQLQPSSITASDVREWLMWLSGHGNGTRTLRRKLQSARAWFKYLMRHGLMSDNPAADVELPKMPKRLPAVVREQSMNQLLDSDVDADDFTAVRDRLIVMMLYETGIRRAELIGLLDAHVDTAAMTIKVRGKRDKERIVPMGSELKQWIDRYRELRGRCVGQECGTFFVRDTGEALYPSLVYRVVHSSLQAVGGGSKLSPHVLRHSFASAMLNHGARLSSVKELLGHESLATTQVYTHISFAELKNSYEHAHPRAIKNGG